jgi:EAL domain-containing protein (putative c-di-GMP-specific phosphodiesterase class I)
LAATDAAGAMGAVRRILAGLKPPCTLEGQIVDLRAGIGIAFFPEHARDADTLLRDAEQALEATKRSGGDYAVYAATEDQFSPARMALAGELRQAISKGQLVVEYQPFLDLPARRLAGVEATVHWEHPQRGRLPSEQFIPMAEQMGLIDALTWWVLETSLRQSQTWQEVGLRLRLSLRLSIHVLQDPQLARTIGQIMQRHDLQADRLTLTIPHAELIADSVHGIPALARLAALGVCVALDNFGIVHAPLAFLKRLPIEEIRIDTSLVRGMGPGTPEIATVQSLIDLCHHLNLRVVAGGVASKVTWDLLQGLQCDVVQGPALCQPLPAADLAQWLHTSSWEIACQ